MGLYSSTTETKTELPPPTDEERQATAEQSAMIKAQLDAAGYEMITTSEVTYENPARVATYQSSVDTLTSQKAALEAQLQTLNQTSGGSAAQRNQIQSQLQQVNASLTQAQTTLSDEMSKQTTVYSSDVKKKEDQRVIDLRNAGKTAEADALSAQLKAEAAATKGKEEELYAQFLDVAQKTLNSDFSITPEQKAQIDEFTAMYRDPIMKTIDGIKAEIGITEGATFASLTGQLDQISANRTSIMDAFTKLEDRINQTGLDVEGALVESHARAVQNGIDMNAALDQSIAASRALTEQGLFETTKDLRLANARLASSLGRAGTDSNMVERLNSQLLDARKSAELNLAVQAANGKLQVSEKTANALQSIADYRVNLRQTQGQKLEGVASARAQLEADIGNQRLGVRQAMTENVSNAGLRREDVAKMRAGVEENAQKLSSGLRLQAAQPLSALQAGGGALGTLNGLQQQDYANLAGTSAFQQNVVNQQQGLRMAQPTTTQTQTGSVLSGIFSALGVAGSAAGSVMTGIGAL